MSTFAFYWSLDTDGNSQFDINLGTCINVGKLFDMIKSVCKKYLVKQICIPEIYACKIKSSGVCQV